MDIEEIRKSIGKESEEDGKYFGLNMGKTHGEDNSKVDIHNEKVLKLFNLEHLIIHLDCWKGVIFFSEEKGDYNNSLKDFSGWTTEEIIYWLIEEGQYCFEKESEIWEIARVVTTQQRYEVLKRQKWRCNQCGCVLRFSNKSEWGGEVAHIDHIHPFSKKKDYPIGPENINETQNLQGLCPKCNLSKSNKEVH